MEEKYFNRDIKQCTDPCAPPAGRFKAPAEAQPTGLNLSPAIVAKQAEQRAKMALEKSSETAVYRLGHALWAILPCGALAPDHGDTRQVCSPDSWMLCSWPSTSQHLSLYMNGRVCIYSSRMNTSSVLSAYINDARGPKQAMYGIYALSPARHCDLQNTPDSDDCSTGPARLPCVSVRHPTDLQIEHQSHSIQ